jgi:hypothetical protein
MNVFVMAPLADLRKELKPHYGDIGRPSVRPALMIRMLIVGYCRGIRSERRFCGQTGSALGVTLYDGTPPLALSRDSAQAGRLGRAQAVRHREPGAARGSA